MKVGKLKTSQRRDDYPIRNYDIASYGEFNDYPERVKEVSQASPTGQGCIFIFRKFVFGGGFQDLTLANAILNRKNQTGNDLLRKSINDYTDYYGFALHVNYNALAQVSEIQYLPFDSCRIAINAGTKKRNNKIAVHPDWTGRYNLEKKKPKKEEVKYYHVFNPNPDVVIKQIEEAGGIENYNGQVLYFSVYGNLVYPLSPFDAVVTDMSTEESVSTVLHRNAKHNYLPAGMIIKKGKPQSTTDDSKEKDNYDDTGLASEIEKWQGDEKAAKMILVETDFDEEKPEFIPFTIQNFDTMFDSTTKYVQDNIGRIFMQPPILRGVDVGAGFGADLMKNAYDFYNTIIDNDRNYLSETWKYVLQYFETPYLNCDILPLNYNIQATNG